MAIFVREINQADFQAWDEYVRHHSDGTFCHLSGWKTVVEVGAGHRCPYLIAEEDGKVVGILPLTLRKSYLFGAALISSMFAVYGGVLASDERTHRALENAAWEMGQELGLRSVSYKTIIARHKEMEGWSVEQNVAATFHKKLGGDADAILLGIPRKQRAVVRKSLQNGLTCSWERDLKAFYSLYAESVRNLGTPVFPRKLFSTLLDVFGDDVEVQIIRSPSGEAIASLMSFYFNNNVLPYYAGGKSAARTFGAHDFMYYQLMVRAVEKGKRVFDFGRSKVGSGPYKFKKNWGFDPIPLEYEYQVMEGCQLADLSPTNKKFELMVQIWKKLPLGVANILGPSIARHLG